MLDQTYQRKKSLTSCFCDTATVHHLFLQAPAAEDVAIAVDLHQEWPYDIQTTTQMGLYPQELHLLIDFQQRGRQDALSWAAAVGFPGEVLERGRQRVEQGRGEMGEVERTFQGMFVKVEGGKGKQEREAVVLGEGGAAAAMGVVQA
jgi:hypothetical protein